MTGAAVDVVHQVRDRYLNRTPNSLRLHGEAKRWLPGGDTRTANHFGPYPTFLTHGAGCEVTDVDGHRYLDFCNNMSAVVHGHAHPELVAAASAQVSLGTALGAPGEVQARHAELVCARVPSAERVRYCNSGTEAAMLALRAARAVTGRDTIVKIDGGYHGMQGDLEVNMFAGMRAPASPQPGVPDGFPHRRVPRGVPRNVAEDVFVLPYNDLDAAAQLFRAHGSRTAALIVEPMLGVAGGVLGDPDYLHGLRALTEEHGALLIFDECVTFRVGPLQTRFGISPDLTALGNVIGGGLPIGAFGGRADVMAQFDPTRPEPVYHGSTFGGNNLSLRVGVAALRTYSPAEVIRLNDLGERLHRRLPEVGAEVGVRLRTSGVGSLIYLHWGDGPIRDALDVRALRLNAGKLPDLLHLELLNRGLYLPRAGLVSLSMPMTEEHARTLVDAVRDTLSTLRPYVEENLPHLLTEPT